MRETTLSNNEKRFVEQSILESFRIDKRKVDEFRSLTLTFGLEWGSCISSLGDTRVFAQVSCEIAQPKTTRPNEGTIFINLEVGSMAAPHLENGFPLTESAIEFNRILEKTIRESKCIDLESLCIISEEKAWNLRVDLNVLNHEGNILDCACVAAIAAIAHFKRPDVTTSGNNELIIHTAAEKDLIPTVLHHYPICVSYALFNEGKIAVADPTALEERVADSILVLAVNSYKELCCMNLCGVCLTCPDLIMSCSEKAAVRSKRIVDFIKQLLVDDQNNRNDGIHKGFSECINLNKIASSKFNSESIPYSKANTLNSEINVDFTDREEEDQELIKIGTNTITSKNDLKQWNNMEEDSSSDTDNDVEITKKVNVTTNKVTPKKINESMNTCDSEEDETIVLK